MAADRVIVVSNPTAGRGGAASVTEVSCSALRGAGFDPVRIEDGGRSAMGAGIRAAAGAVPGDHPRAIVVCGGDGTVQAVAGAAHDTGIPIYQVPMGTENLFAREFGMTRSVDRMVAAVSSGRTERIDMARCNGDWFLLMCSVGPDAAVVHRLAAARTGAITHMSYAKHIAAELAKPTLTPITITVDGEEVVRDGVGMAVVANSRQYAMRIDPAYRADMRDGELDVVFMPAKSSAALAKWMVLSRVRAQSWGAGVVRTRGRRIEIHNCGGAVPFQLDGEAGLQGANPTLDIEIVPGALGVVVG